MNLNKVIINISLFYFKIIFKNNVIIIVRIYFFVEQATFNVLII